MNIDTGARADLYQSFGLAGIVVVRDTATYTGQFCAVQVLSAATIESVSAKPSMLTGDITGVPIPAGIVIYFPFSSIKLTSGSVIVYRMALPEREAAQLLPA